MTDEKIKLGRRNNSADEAEINKIVDSAIKLGATHPRLTREEIEDMQDDKPLKFDGDYLPFLAISQQVTIKASGDWELDVLGIPFGGPNNGKDTDGQYFSARTKTYFEFFKEIPVFYYHGFNPDRTPQGTPEVIGTAKFDRTDEQGHWFKVSLNRASNFARRVWDAALKGLARASSGAISHLVRVARDGEILQWATAELSVFDTDKNRQPANAYAVAMPALKARMQSYNLSIPSELDDNGAQSLPEASNTQAADDTATNQPTKGAVKMETEDITKLVAAEFEKQAATKAAADKLAADEAAKIEAAVKMEREKWEADAAKANRLPSNRAPYATKFADTNDFDGLSAADTAVLISTVKSAGKPVSDGAYKALRVKLEEDKSETGREGIKAMKAVGLHNIKANEMDYSTLANYGDEWVGVAYSTALWEAIRVGTFVLGRIPQIEVPAGVESMYLPLESTDPIYYKVAETTSSNTAQAAPVPTVTASQLGTGRVLMTLAKMGARVVWSGELDESSLIPFASQLRQQLAVSGAEYLESAILDGDTETGATTNINDIAGTPAATDWFMLFNGPRKSALVTTTANSRSAAGSLDVTDYLETVKLMGGAGINALDRSKVGFIVDPSTYYKTLALPEVLTRDTYSAPTIEGGQLTGLFGYGLNVSAQMHKASAVRKANSAGKVDVDTVANNTTGSILAVRFDQWKFGWRRRMTMETTRFANSDSNEIVAMMRVGLIQRDTEAAAITYNVGV